MKRIHKKSGVHLLVNTDGSLNIDFWKINIKKTLTLVSKFGPSFKF